MIWTKTVPDATPELIAVITATIALAGLGIGLSAWRRQPLRELRGAVAGLREPMAHVEGPLARISHRRLSSSESALLSMIY